MKCLSIVFLFALAVSGCDYANKSPTKSDNSAINQRDQNGANKTPFDQNENQKDIDITASIRRQIVATDMSVNAQNVKIVTQDGKVTLRGPVSSADEKQRIETIARKVAGETKVDSQLDVANSN
ncbi:BON domain-containing protein [Pirellulaceae bacterium SH467]